MVLQHWPAFPTPRRPQGFNKLTASWSHSDSQPHKSIPGASMYLFIWNTEKTGRREGRIEPGVEFSVGKELYSTERENLSSGHFDQNTGSTSHFSYPVFPTNKWQAAGHGALGGS